MALWRAGERVLSRSGKYHRPRGLQCMQEHCASCLVRIDGVPNRFACTTPCADGMKVERQNAFPNAARDVLRAIDWCFPKTFNHHELLAGVPVAARVMAKVARQLSGLGRLPDAPGAPFEPGQDLRVGTLVVGLGRSGRAWLRTSAADGPLADPPRDLFVDATDAVDAAPLAGNERVWPSARALGVYLEGAAPVLAVRRGRALWRVRPTKLILCVGSRAQLLPFAGNDLPGVMTDAAALLLVKHGVRPGQRALVAGDAARAASVAEALRGLNVDVTMLAPAARLLRAEGGHRLRRAVGVTSGAEVAWRVDALVVAGPRAPAFELAEQAGAQIAFVPGRGFAVRTDARGQTSVPWLWAFGSCAESGC